MGNCSYAVARNKYYTMDFQDTESQEEKSGTKQAIYVISHCELSEHWGH